MFTYSYKYLIASIFFMSLLFTLKAQPHLDEYGQAKKYLIAGDYLNATTLIKKLITFDSANIELKKDLAICYNFQREYNNAVQTLKTLVDSGFADDQCFQISGNAYKALNQIEACKTLFLKGLAKFPDNGPLYNEMASLLWNNKDNSCIKYWEKGIEKDPEYSKNYYNACRYYNNSNEKMWSLIYGEIFVNMEPSNSRTPEIKQLLLDDYRKIFTEIISDSVLSAKNKFSQKYLGNLYKQYTVLKEDINAATLSMLRTRFILDWFYDNPDEFPSSLFSFHQTLLKQGLFDVYNQWLLGSSDNLLDFQNWTMIHQEEYEAFIQFQKTASFKMPKGQYYH